MNKTIYILSSFFAGLLITDPLFAQQSDAPSSLQDSINLVDLNPSSISVTGKLYALPKVSVMESGNVGASSVLMLRGVNSINLSTSPLVYVDGIPLRYTASRPTFLSTYEPDRLGFLNPYDVTDISVNASGLLIPKVGGRGANGVLDIKTERGEFGGTKVDFSANYGLNNVDYNVPRFDAQSMKSYLWARFSEEGMPAQQLDQHPIFSATDPVYNNNTDWLDLIRQRGVFQDYHLKLKGGDGDANYMFAVGYTNKDGTVKNTDFERIGIRFNLDYNLSPSIKIFNNLSYTNTSGHYKDFGSDYAVHPLYVASAKSPFMATHFINPNGEQSRIMAGVDTLGFSNPLALVNNLENKNQFNRIDGVMGVNWALAESWSLSSDLSVSYFNLSEKQYRPALGIVNDLYRIRQNSQRSSSEFYLNWNGRLAKSGKISESTNYEGALQASVETYEEKAIYGRKINAGTDDFETLEQGIVDSASNTEFRSNLMTLMAQGAITWNDRVDIDGFINVQGSSNFGSNARWNLYPGARATVYVWGEKPQNILNLLLGYDRTGNHEVRGFYHYNQYYPVNYFGFGAVYLGNVANPDLRPEITDTYEIKATARPFGNRLQFNLGYYYKRTHDLITHKAVVKELGIDGLFENAGTVENKGLELGLSAQLISSKDFNWNMSASVSTLKNKVLSLPNGDVEQSIGMQTGIAKEGYALGSFYGYKVLGVFQSEADVNLNKSDGTPYRAGDYQIEDLNGDGRISTLDRQVLGAPLPEFFGHVSTNFSYKKWGLIALINFSQGADIYNSFKQQMHLMRDYANQDPAVLTRWASESEPGSGLSRAATNDPSGNGVASSLWVEDGSYVKLKNLTLHYEITSGKSQHFFKRIRIYFSADNLFTWTNYTGFDPEVNSLNSPMLRNIDFGAPPLGKTYKLGFRASF
ncbi:SusC/RagA family TonB-linked outer membrane protein [Sphingobacterium pedocola]|uniref:SusC/RagA family TonB-linked outer membrane protein n=1 Tax=Sphingobacterium pedocola TaxID=2082722 RepID=A0ABR9T710_9SPHI|nr:SusC/RagA family TonB-linked outer membrane protein [Sphingobacterium pedocola]MBE8721106.1 SusC/RagA family TonB-linked outer membrane protein [Sphingobacterium pedocola]